MANLPQLASATGRALATTANAATRTGSTAMRTVGVSRVDPAVVRQTATAVATMSKSDKNALVKALGNKKVVLGGTAIAGGALIGYGADELFDVLNNASPEELTDFLSYLDSVDPKAGDSVVDMYNHAVRVSELDNNFSDDRSADGFVSQASVTGLGLDRAVIENQQVMVQQYRNLRGILGYEQLLALQFLLAHATPADISTLEDMYRYGRF